MMKKTKIQKEKAKVTYSVALVMAFLASESENRQLEDLLVNCFTENTFSFRHFTVSLQYFEFCPVESEEKSFLSVTLASLRTPCTTWLAKRTTFEFFHFLEAREDSIYLPIEIGIFQREIWKNIGLQDVQLSEGRVRQCPKKIF